MGLGFAEGKIEGEKVLEGGTVFPKTYVPSKPNESSADDLVDAVSAHRERLSEELRQHGAILFRGYRVHSAEEFSRVVEAMGWEEQHYPVSANRVKLCDRVYSASEFPLHVFISFHHEMSLLKEFCAKIFFVCLVAPPEGGETSIVRSDVIVDKMEAAVPEAVEKFCKDGMISVVHFRKRYDIDGAGEDSKPKKVWHQVFKTEDETAAKERATEMLRCNSVKLNEDGTTDVFYGPLNPIKELGGKKVWFNNILGYTTDEKVAEVRYGDGTPLPAEVSECYERILEENCVNVRWEKGDVLMVDNHRVQHARRPGKPPRQVLVSVCK